MRPDRDIMIQGKWALITGSIAGLGRAVAESLANAGANIIVHALADPRLGQEEAAKLAEDHKVETAFSNADLSRLDEIERMMGSVSERFGGADIVVNNAVVRHFSPIDAFAAKDWDHSLAVNLTGAFHVMRLAIPHMRSRGWGRIINMSSIYGSRGGENRIDYVTTKTALLGMTRAAAIELARTGITCNAVCPGTVPTPAILDRIEAIANRSGIDRDAAEAEYLAERNPTGRFVSSMAVGELVRFVCSESGADITGATLPIDGGWLAR